MSGALDLECPFHGQRSRWEAFAIVAGLISERTFDREPSIGARRDGQLSRQTKVAFIHRHDLFQSGELHHARRGVRHRASVPHIPCDGNVAVFDSGSVYMQPCSDINIRHKSDTAAWNYSRAARRIRELQVRSFNGGLRKAAYGA